MITAGSGVVSNGPNASMFYTRQELPAPTLTVYMNLGLFPGSNWYALHHGQVAPNIKGRRYCTATQLDQLRSLSRQHEGIDPGFPTSHVAAYQASAQLRDFNKELEAITAQIDDAQGVPILTQQGFLDRLYSARASWKAAMDTDPGQVAIDSPSSPTYLQVPCRLDFTTNVR
jgi:hypothetical protein